MSKFLDVHPMKGFDEKALRKLQKSPVEEFGISIITYCITKK
jgi:hypothetical protein